MPAACEGVNQSAAAGFRGLANEDEGGDPVGVLAEEFRQGRAANLDDPLLATLFHRELAEASRRRQVHDTTARLVGGRAFPCQFTGLPAVERFVGDAVNRKGGVRNERSVPPTGALQLQQQARLARCSAVKRRQVERQEGLAQVTLVAMRILHQQKGL